MDHDEARLVRRCLAGDQDACASLVERFGRLVGTVIWQATGDAGAHVVIDHLRRSGRDPERFDDKVPLEALPSSPGVDPLSAAARDEIDRLVHNGLAQVPEKHRVPLVYAAIDGLDYDTIAAMLGVPVGT